MMDGPANLVLNNARLVLADRVIERGWLSAEHGRIAGFGSGSAPGALSRQAVDCDGDLLIPGLVELHTDHLEAHFLPRPGVVWHAHAAVQAYDAQMVAAGVTTVFDSLRVGQDERKDVFSDYAGALLDTIAAAQQAGLLRADHHTHLRCEVCSDDVVSGVEGLLGKGGHIGLISLMDHTPGQRQFRNVERLIQYYSEKHGMSAVQIDHFMAERRALHARNSKRHRRALVALAQGAGIAIASHDDATVEQVEEAIADGIRIAEFPTTIEAAVASHKAEIKVLMGAPNVVRGGSHSGNVAAQDLATAGTLDILSSDYVPGSLLLAALRLEREVESIDLPHAIALVTRNPARAVGLADRGEIAAGLKADFVRVRQTPDVPVVRAVWRDGQRVM